MSAEQLTNYLGSPPLTWRTLVQTQAGVAMKWITSTYVENTFVLPKSYRLIQDHLHFRGEHPLIMTV